MLLLKCPHCGNQMKYGGNPVGGKRKSCVYCGRSFIIMNHVLSEVR